MRRLECNECSEAMPFVMEVHYGAAETLDTEATTDATPLNPIDSWLQTLRPHYHPPGTHVDLDGTWCMARRPTLQTQLATPYASFECDKYNGPLYKQSSDCKKFVNEGQANPIYEMTHGTIINYRTSPATEAKVNKQPQNSAP
ncbi:unnamed protein product [Nezara viridula]|uniref:Uncharacterized protein n=1 Tax=Nezara viridula TaxID=85310 RepID=A0A9P0MVK1_NEZVI|nr:unnamed protein product [Nezara viridula]